MVIEVFMHPNSELRGTYDAQIETYGGLWLINFLKRV